MTDTHEQELSPAERWKDIDRMTAEMRQAVREALRRHKLLGRPVAVLRDDKVVWLQPEEIPE